ncbi:MAG: leucine-rich repeat domain-containing protein, partial [Propionibacteriaceae bacterium]|nr:leucine-rich repeat domain-containing protein [Propionibacteriaceae bacterium]
MNISSIEGVQFLTGITSLDLLNNNNLSDVGPIAGLASSASLERLGFGGDQISDVSPFAAFAHSSSLAELDLLANQISDVAPLASLSGASGFSKLYLDKNQIADITPLAGLTALSELSLNWNQIGDITPLAGLTGLSVLGLGYNQISDVTPLAGFTNLTFLGLNGNQIGDISSLANMMATWNKTIGGGVSVREQTVTLSLAAPGTIASPVVSTTGEPVEMVAESGPVTVNADGTITCTAIGKAKLNWDTTAPRPGDLVFSGTLIVTVGETPSATPAPDTPSVPPSSPPTEVGSSHGVLTMVIIGLAVVVVGA